MQDQHTRFMKMAIRISETNVSKSIGGPFGAVIVKEGIVIAKSGNRVTATNDPTAHAEVSAIRIACRRLSTFDLSGTVIYTSCEPCPMCLSAIYWARIDAIYYANTKQDAGSIGFDDDFIYQELALPYSSRKVPIVQMMRDEAQSAFKLWQKTDLKIRY